MQTKKRARSAKFGAKAKPAEEKKEEQKESPVVKEAPVVNETPSANIQPSEQSKQPQVPLKEEAVVKVENKEEKPVAESVVNIAAVPVIEKDTAQINQEEPQVREEVAAVPSQDQEVPASSQINTEVAKEPVVNDSYVVQTEVKKNMISYFLVVAVISFLVGILSMAGISFFFQKTPFGLPFIAGKAEITPSPKPTVTAVPTKVKEVNLAEYNIEILNGSGVTGAAAKLKTVLTEEGFAVVSTGNAERDDFTDTVISTKKGVNQAYLEKLKESLKKMYTLAPVSKTPISESSEADIVVTVGSKTAVKQE